MKTKTMAILLLKCALVFRNVDSSAWLILSTTLGEKLFNIHSNVSAL